MARIHRGLVGASALSPLVVLLVALSTVFSQDSERNFDEEMHKAAGGNKMLGKYLTPGMIDRWLFEAKKGETIIAFVTR